ncbi:hypothetical protein N7490_010439 [Penicillium lividum]|nr:hypothetical protein N7490_010439 [Penicillium lividum]
MAENHETDLITAALEHHQEALNLFISHLATPNAHSWVTFPALWFFITYEQTYGEDPRVMEAHLRGVRDVIASHGRTILASSLIDDGSSSGGSEERFRVPPKMINRIALWTIHQDAKASTFGLGGSMIDLLNEKYPDSIDRIFEDSSTALQDAWGLMYPAVEDLWDRQAHEMFRLVHENTMLRYKLAKIEKEDYEDDEKERTSRKIMQFGRDLKLLEKKFLPFMEPALSRRIERSPLLSNMCVIVAEFLALVVQYERLAYDVQSLSLPKLLQVCASLYEYEGPNFLRHVAWALLVAGFETEDSVYQSWIIERFAQLQKSGNNMRQAMILLQAVFLEKRTSTEPIRYSEWLRDDRFKKFSI